MAARPQRTDVEEWPEERIQSVLEERSRARAVAGPEPAIRADGGDWDPETADLREDEQSDDRTHAARNAEQLTMADDTTDDDTADELPPLHIGDHVTDRDDQDATMLVVGLDTHQADAYELDTGGPTVAEVNPEYPADDDVIGVVFPSRTDMDVDTKRYAYPRSRLQLETPIHDRDSDGGEE